MFWGCHLKNDTQLELSKHKAWQIYITNIALSTVPENSGKTLIWVKVGVPDEQKILICTLESGKYEHAKLDLCFRVEQEVQFYVEGKGEVFLAGYYEVKNEDQVIQIDSQETHGRLHGSGTKRNSSNERRHGKISASPRQLYKNQYLAEHEKNHNPKYQKIIQSNPQKKRSHNMEIADRKYYVQQKQKGKSQRVRGDVRDEEEEDDDEQGYDENDDFLDMNYVDEEGPYDEIGDSDDDEVANYSDDSEDPDFDYNDDSLLSKRKNPYGVLEMENMKKQSKNNLGGATNSKPNNNKGKKQPRRQSHKHGQKNEEQYHHENRNYQGGRNQTNKKSERIIHKIKGQFAKKKKAKQAY